MRRGLISTAIATACCAAFPAASAAQLPPLLPVPPTARPAPPPPSAPAPPVGYTGTSVGRGVTPGQGGWVDDPSLTMPLAQRWTTRTSGELRQLIYGAGMWIGRTTAGIVAYRVRTGAPAWSVPDYRNDATLTHAGGVVVFVDAAGRFRGVDARTGANRWTTAPPVSGYDRYPVAAGGSVFIAGEKSVVAYDVASGRRRWARDVPRLAGSLSSDGVRVYGARSASEQEDDRCARAFALDAATGRQLWERAAARCGGTASVTPVHRERVYVDDDDRVLDAASGAQVGTYAGGPAVLAGNVGIFDPPGLVGRDLMTGRVLWTHRAKDPLQGGQNNPTAVGNTAYALDGSHLLAVGLDRGTTDQRFELPGRNQTTRELATGPGVLAATRGNRLTTYESLYEPPARGIAAGAETPGLEFGKSTLVDGVVGAGLRGARPKVQILGDASPFGRFRRVLTVSSDGGGYFSLTAKPARNTRLRMRAGPARSNLVRLYVYPRFRARQRRSPGNPNRIRAAVRVAGPRSVRLGGRRVTLYVGRVARRRYDRLGTGRLRSAGRGRGRATVTFEAVRGLRRKDFLFFCIRRSSRLGLGRPDVIDRRCGARRMPLR